MSQIPIETPTGSQAKVDTHNGSGSAHSDIRALIAAVTGAVSSVAGRVGAVVLGKSDVGLGNVDNTSDSSKNSATATLTNKTLTSPVVNSPTGIVKADVGLGNVDNTSNATERAATATLTNKTLTSPVVNTPTGIVKADVGLAAVDNTSDATKNTAVATLTNKTLTSPVVNSPTGIVKADVGLGNCDNTADTAKPVSTAQQTALNTKTDKAALAAAGTQRLQWLIAQDLEDVSIVLVGDSTGVGATSWFQNMATSVASSWPARTVRIRNWNTSTHTYDAPSTLQTGSGSRAVDFYNASVASTNTFFPIDVDFDTRLVSLQPTMCMISEGHNEGTSSTNRDVVTAAMINLCESVTAVCPSTDLVLVGQNPETNNSNQQRCSAWYRQIAGQRGYGYMSTLEAFLADARWALGTGGGGIMSDTIHPNNAGYTLWAATLAPFFTTYDTTLPVLAPAPSTLLHAQRNLLVNGDFSTYTTSPGAPDNWTASGSPTITKDAVTVEDAVKGWSVKVLGSGSAAGEIYQNVDVSLVKGKVVTLVVREFIPTAGSAGTSGQVAIEDDSGTTSTRSSVYGLDGWRWTTITRRISATATTCRIHLYGVNAATAGVAYFDRASLVLGRWPTRAVPAPQDVAAGSGILPTIVDVKGDLIVGTGADTVARQAVGANGTVLKADSAQTGGVAWGSPVDVQTFTSGTSNWTKPAGCSFVTVALIGGSGGGGSGARQPSGTATSGGGGGAGAGWTMNTFPAATLGATESVTVGAPGTAGAAVTTNGTNGNAGGAGGTSTFGTTVRARAVGGNGGGAGAAAAPGAATAGGGLAAGGSGGAPASGAAGGNGTGANMAGPGGGAGGGISATPAAFGGGNGGAPAQLGIAGGAGGAADTAGTAGTAGPTGAGVCGGGGGGGGASITGAGAAGAAGGAYGAGSGGGGSSLNGNNSGAGVAGAPGLVVVTSY